MAITPYRPTTDPFRAFFDDVFGPEMGGRMAGTDLMRTPHADVAENKEEIRVTVELPGMRPDDVDVDLENNILTISGQKHEERQEGDQESRWHLSERRYGRFSRSFVLPRDVEHERIEARFENGVLHVTIPKGEKARPRRIDVKSGDGARQIETSTSGESSKGTSQ
jgi:HSP20 family protein